MKKKMFTALMLILVLTLALTGCGKEKQAEKSKAETAIENIKKIDTKDYFTEDKDKVKSLAGETIKRLKKADEEIIKGVLAEFNDKLSKIPKKSASLKVFEDKLKEEISELGDDKTKAEEIFNSYIQKIKTVKSKAELDKLSSEITGKVKEATGKEIANVKASEVTQTAVKEAPKNQVTASSKSSSGVSSSNSGNSNSSAAAEKTNKTSNSSSKQEKKKRVIHHDEQGHYETKIIEPEYQEPIYETRVVTSDGKIFDTVEEAGEYIDSFDFEDPNAPQNYSSKKVQIGTRTVPAVTEKVWVVDKPAWDEVVWE